MDKPLIPQGVPLPPEQLFSLTQITRQDVERAIATASPGLRPFLLAKR